MHAISTGITTTTHLGGCKDGGQAVEHPGRQQPPQLQPVLALQVRRQHLRRQRRRRQHLY